MIELKARRRANAMFAPIGKALARVGVRAWHVTLFGLIVALAGAALIAAGRLQLGVGFVLVGSAIDALDGAVARARGSVSARGALLDSVTDRVEETAMWTGLALAVSDTPAWVALCTVSLGGSLLISYLRAKVETGGVDGRGGIMGRAERLILFGAGILSGLIGPMLWAMVALVWITVVQRFWIGWKRLDA
jgi:CDP-diacylglycerol--glycerol-3-phosphate 3-phosphatidyltransferase